MQAVSMLEAGTRSRRFVTADYVLDETATLFKMRHADHQYSFTDCFSFVMMNALNLTEALTKNIHFREAGFRPLLLD